MRNGPLTLDLNSLRNRRPHSAWPYARSLIGGSTCGSDNLAIVGPTQRIVVVNKDWFVAGEHIVGVDAFAVVMVGQPRLRRC